LIPEDEIWLKVGGDKGGKNPTTKLNFQIANVKCPNSADNTTNFACFDAPDSLPNITIAMSKVKAQLDTLASMSWK
tara:strand:+ start:804 stop:1031 length:228 start_codon:yes stop_codon:yes gene_type:complete